MDKSEILDYIKKYNKEHGGFYTTERGFRKQFPEMYEIFIQTEFPDFFNEFDFKQKLWHFLRNDYELHVCKCGGKLKFRSFWFGYNEFCKPNCPAMIDNQIKHVKSKNETRTEEEKKEIQNKVENTFLLRYGVTRYSQTSDWKEKTLEKNNKKFGKDWYTQTDEYKINFENYCERKYGKGVKNPFQDERIKKIINQKFYENFFKKHPEVIDIKDDILVCKCYDETCTLCDKKIYEIDKITFSNRKCKNIDTCIIRNGYGNVSSGSENNLYDFIKSIYDGKIIRNDRSVLEGKEIDVYLPELKLGFEFNGVYWHSELYKDRMYHQNKTLTCLDKNINLVQIWEDDWLYNNDIVKCFIKSKLDNKNNDKTCLIKEISCLDTNNFLKKYNPHVYIKNGINIGLICNNEIVGVLTFRNHKKEGYFEIYMYSENNTCFNKLLEYFEINYRPIEITVYVNLEDTCIIKKYIDLEFKKQQVIKPTYTWVVNNKRKHRSNFTKSKLQECKDNPELTEIEVMYDRGCWRCWDSGKIKFVKTYNKDINNLYNDNKFHEKNI